VCGNSKGGAILLGKGAIGWVKTLMGESESHEKAECIPQVGTEHFYRGESPLTMRRLESTPADAVRGSKQKKSLGVKEI